MMSVKLMLFTEPPNTAAFAFVKYKNPEAPVKAVEAKVRMNVF